MPMLFCWGCGKEMHDTALACPHCGAPRKVMSASTGKNRIVAIVLAICLGGFGAHKFYLGQVGLGILYLLFFWTLIPGIAAFIEFIIYLTMTDEAFATKYPL